MTRGEFTLLLGERAVFSPQKICEILLKSVTFWCTFAQFSARKPIYTDNTRTD